MPVVEGGERREFAELSVGDVRSEAVVPATLDVQRAHVAQAEQLLGDLGGEALGFLAGDGHHPANQQIRSAVQQTLHLAGSVNEADITERKCSMRTHINGITQRVASVGRRVGRTRGSVRAGGRRSGRTRWRWPAPHQACSRSRAAPAPRISRRAEWGRIPGR